MPEPIPTENWVEEAQAASDNGHAPGLRDDSLRLYSADSIRVRLVEWLDEGRVPLDAVTVLAGFGGLGKSTWTCDLAGTVTLGTTKDALAGKPCGVVICSSEDVWEHTIKPRLIAAGADLSLVLWVGVEDSDTEHPDPAVLSFPDDIDRIEAAINTWQDEHSVPIALIVLDPFVAFMGDDVDTHRDKDSRRALDPLAAMAHRLHLAIIGVMHFNKKDGASTYKRLSSSHAFFNAVRSVLVWGIPPDGTKKDSMRLLASGKMNLAPEPPTLVFQIDTTTIETGDPEVPKMTTVRVVHDGESDIAADDLLKASGRSGMKIEQAKLIIEDEWDRAGRAVPAATILNRGDKEGIGERTMRRALEQLGGTKDKDGMEGGWLWCPPKGFFDNTEGAPPIPAD